MPPLVTTSQAVADHIKARYETEKEFRQVQCDERSRTALRCRVRAIEHHYQVGEEVYYKQDEEQNRWCGPATVIGNKGMWHFLIHQGVIMRVAANRLVTGKQDPKQVTKHPEGLVSNGQSEKNVWKTEKAVTLMRVLQPPAVVAEQEEQGRIKGVEREEEREVDKNDEEDEDEQGREAVENEKEREVMADNVKEK